MQSAASWEHQRWSASEDCEAASSGLAMTVDHMPPFGPLAGLMVAIAAWQFLAAGRGRDETWVSEAAS